MNEIIESLHARKSVRAFLEKEVSQEIKDALIDATLQAPSAGNQIMYSIIDVCDSKLKEQLSISCDNQPFIKKAPLVYIFVADHTRWIQSYNIANTNPRKLGVGDIFLAMSDACIAAQNMVVAAQSLGLGSCYIGDILENCNFHRELLNLPEHSIPVCMLVLGYPTQQQENRKKPARFDKKYIVGVDTYPNLSDQEVKQCYIDRSKQSGKEEVLFNEEISAFCKRKYNSEFSIEMTRSVEEYLKSFK